MDIKTGGDGQRDSEFSRILVHQWEWLCIHAKQQHTSPIGFLFLIFATALCGTIGTDKGC